MNYDFTLRPDATRFEEGSFNTMSIQAFGQALSLFHEVGVERIEKQIMLLGDKILAELKRRNFKILNSVIPEERSGIISFTGELDLTKLSEFMADNKVSLTVRDGMVRLSPHFYNSENEIDRFFDPAHLNLICAQQLPDTSSLDRHIIPASIRPIGERRHLDQQRIIPAAEVPLADDFA